MSAKTASVSMRLRRFWCTMLALVVVVAGAPMAAPQSAIAVEPMTYRVDQTTGNDSTGDGSVAAPFKTITKALEMATNDDTVVVGPGTYNVASGETFPLLFSGTSLVSTAGAASTVIEGQAARIAIAEQFEEGDVISGFTFSAGVGGAGSAIACYLTWPTGSGWPRIEHNVFENNDAGSSWGGALYFYAGSAPGTRSPVVEKNTFRGNRGGAGGAVAVENNISITIRNNEFTENTAISGGAIRIRTNGQAVEVSENRFGANEAQYDGGAIHVTDSAAPEQAPNVMVGRNTFSSNIAQRNGGGLYIDGAAVDVYGNDGGTSDAVEGGFGYLANGARVISVNNRIFGGSADTSGSAWRVVDSGLGERHDTVAFNSGRSVVEASGTSGGVYIDNSVYWNELSNDPTGLLHIEIANAKRVSDCCVRDAAVADASRGNVEIERVIFDDPLFVDAAHGDARLAVGSPCIDSANPAKSLAEDFFGTVRPLDGDGSGTAEPDMGYHEVKAPTTLSLSTPYSCNYTSLSGSGYLRDLSGTGIGGRSVTIESSYDRIGWNKITTRTTNSSGYYSFAHKPYKRTYYRARFTGDDTLAEAASAVDYSYPRVYLSAPNAPATMNPGRSYSISGYLKPRHAAGTYPVRIYRQRYVSGGWKTYGTYVNARAYNYSYYTKYVARVSLPYAGKWRIMAHHPMDWLNYTTNSSWDYIWVR